jgi:surfeit locus 1 family protein
VTVGGGKRLFLLGLVRVLALLFAGLGVWQVERLRWKLDLIERVEARLAAPPVPLGARRGPASCRATSEYRRVRLTGASIIAARPWSMR